MARRFEKIEKELGYCEIKLEKERRLRKQVEFLDADLYAVDSLLDILRQFSDAVPPESEGFLAEKPAREAFFVVGLRELTREKRTLLQREREEIVNKLDHFEGFVKKRANLEREKRLYLDSIPSSKVEKMRELNENFKRVEHQWNRLTEDLTNIDDAIFFLGRNLDYLRSCRNFMIAAKGSIDLENGRPTGTLTDLFRHSNVGRAVEMADGADRNLRCAQKELVCVSDSDIAFERFASILERFVEAVYEDLYEELQIERSVQLIEGALATNLQLFEDVKAMRESFAEKLDACEQHRERTFNRMGSARRKEVVV